MPRGHSGLQRARHSGSLPPEDLCRSLIPDHSTLLHCSPHPQLPGQRMKALLLPHFTQFLPSVLPCLLFWELSLQKFRKEFRGERVPLPIVYVESAGVLSLRGPRQNGGKGTRWHIGQGVIGQWDRVRKSRFSGPELKDTRGSVTFSNIMIFLLT